MISRLGDALSPKPYVDHQDSNLGDEFESTREVRFRILGLRV